MKPGEGRWTKVAEMQEGQVIAVAGKKGNVVWDAIAKIEKMAPEQVYDIEIEGTHNFIGNDIVAHNTMVLGQGTGALSAANGVVSAGTLSLSNGGTGTSTAPVGQLLYGGASAYQSVATTSATIGGSLSYSGTFGALVGGSAGTLSLNMGNANTWTALQTFANASTTNISATYASSTSGFFGSLSIGSLSGFLKATAGSVATAAIDLANDVTGVLTAARGGTGWGNITANTIVLGNGTNSLATTTAGTNGQVLALVAGVPSWVATTTLSTISGTLGVASGGTGQDSSAWTGIAVVSSGTWSASSTLALNVGGTGATTASGARTNLGLVLGTDVQAYDGELAAIAGLTSAADKLPYFTGSGTASLADFSSFARTFLDDASAGAVRTTLSAAASGANSDITSIAGLTTALSVAQGGTGWAAIQSGAIPYGNGASSLATTTAGTNGYVLSLASGIPTWVATTSLSTIGGTLGVASGGTGATTFTSSQLLYGNGTSALSSVATSSITLGSEFSHSGTIGSLIGGTSGSLTLAANGVALTKLAQIAANSILGNTTGATGNVTAIATTSLFAGTNGQVLAFVNGAWVGTATTTFGTGLTYAAGNVTVNTTQNIAKLSNLTGNGFVKTSGSDGTLSIDTNSYALSSSLFGKSWEVSGGFLSPTTTLYVTNIQQASSTVFSALTAKFGATASSSFASDGSLTLASALGVSSGGTGLSSYTLGSVLYASGTGTLAGTTTANLKATLALNNVENTALSTWAGSTNLTTLGTISTGVWNGTSIAIANGGTGTTTAASGQLLYGGASAYQSVATSSPIAGTAISLSGSGALVGSALTINFQAPTTAGLSIPFASTTMITATTASTTNLWISGIASGSLLKTTTGGQVTNAVAGSDFINSATRDWQVAFGALTPTTTLGILVSASSTIGAGGQATGLTINGGATTTGNATFGGTLTLSTHCVTADTRLRRRRRRKDGSYQYDEPMIKDIEAGDEVASMDPKTGKIVWSEAKGIVDMGEKTIYQLTTQSGKRIRTTDNHPYFVRTKYDEPKATHKAQKLYRFEVDMSVRFDEYSRDSVVAIANAEQKITVSIPRNLKQMLRDSLLGNEHRKTLAAAMFANAILFALKSSQHG